MSLVSFIKLFRWAQKNLKSNNKGYYEDQPKIIKLDLPLNPNYKEEKYWGYRPLSMIKNIVEHQELGEGTTQQVHAYHTSKECHLKLGVGAPKIAYHYTIEKNGTIYHVNKDTDVVWQCKGGNLDSLGIMLVGDFTGPSHIGKTYPTFTQKKSLFFLLRHLMKEHNVLRVNIRGHSFYGKENCPGYEVEDLLEEFKDSIKI